MSRTGPTLILEQFLPYKLVQLAQRISTSFSATYREQFGISIAEWRIIANLAEQGAMTSKDIARRTSMDKAKVSRAIRELDQKGHVAKRADERDNRAYWLSLNARGMALYRRIVPLALAWEAELLQTLDAAEYRDLMRVIEKISRRLGAQDETDEGEQE